MKRTKSREVSLWSAPGAAGAVSRTSPRMGRWQHQSPFWESLARRSCVLRDAPVGAPQDEADYWWHLQIYLIL